MSSDKQPPKTKDKVETLMSVHLEGYEVIEKQVKSSGGTGRVYLPTAWIGSRVKIVRVTPKENAVDN